MSAIGLGQEWGNLPSAAGVDRRGLSRIRVFVSGASDTDDERDVTMKAVVALHNMLQGVFDSEVVLDVFDYRLDNPTVVASGRLAEPSLSRVRRSQLMVAVLGDRPGEISIQEVKSAFEKRSLGRENMDVHVFSREGLENKEWAMELISEIERDFSEQVIAAAYDDLADFQSKVHITLFEAVLRKLGLPTVDAGGVHE